MHRDTLFMHDALNSQDRNGPKTHAQGKQSFECREQTGQKKLVIDIVDTVDHTEIFVRRGSLSSHRSQRLSDRLNTCKADGSVERRKIYSVFSSSPYTTRFRRDVPSTGDMNSLIKEKLINTFHSFIFSSLPRNTQIF